MIVIKEADGTIRHPFGKTETPQEKIERSEKELEEREMRLDLLEEVVADLIKVTVE